MNPPYGADWDCLRLFASRPTLYSSFGIFVLVIFVAVVWIYKHFDILVMIQTHSLLFTHYLASILHSVRYIVLFWTLKLFLGQHFVVGKNLIYNFFIEF